MIHHLTVGRAGEDIAVLYLKDHGYEILERNTITTQGELDIIAKQGEIIVFVEVKARSRCDGFDPSLNVDRKKLRRLQRAALTWLKGQDIPSRIDVLGIVQGKVVGHLEDVL